MVSLRPLLPWQSAAIDFGKNKDHVGFLMDKRLGKCLIAIRWVLGRECRNIFIVAPLSACPGWLEEIRDEGQEGRLLYGTAEERLIELVQADARFSGKDAQFFVINPQGLFRSAKRGGTGDPIPNEIALLPWDCVILDESVGIKNPKSQINKIFHACFRSVRCRAILSGEPAPEGPLDLFEQMRWLLGGYWMGKRNFWAWRHDNFLRVGFEWHPKPGKLREIKEALNAHCFRLTRKAAGVGERKTFERRWCDLPPKVRRVYDHAEKYFELPASMTEAGQIEGSNPPGSHYQTEAESTKFAMVVRQWLNQIAGGYPKDHPGLESPHKMQVLMELLKGELIKEQVICVFRYNREIAAAEAACRAAKIRFAALTGAVAPAVRGAVQTKFKAGEIRIILAQIKVLKYGIDLSAADTMIRYSLTEGWDDISQSQDRIIHPQKKTALHYIDICCKNTVNEDLLDTLTDKSVVARYFVSKLMEKFNDRRNKKAEST